MSSKSYRGRLPSPDAQGRWRPVVGRSPDGKPQRFQVGNKRDTTEAEAQRRLDYIRDFYDRQCAELGKDCWAPWALPWAIRLATGTPICVSGSEDTRSNPGEAAEQVSIVERLQSWGVPIRIIDPAMEASAYSFLRKRVEVEVKRAVEEAIGYLSTSWGAMPIERARQEAVPKDMLDAETRPLHEALDAYSEHLKATGKRDQDGNLATRVGKCRDRLNYLKAHHEDIPLWKLDLP